MSARAVLQAAVVARLGSVAGLRVFDAPPVRGGVPYAVVDEPVLRQADAAGIAGRTGTVGVVLHDSGERPVRLRALQAAVEDAVETAWGDVGEGWRLIAVVLARSRIAPRPDDRWMAISEFAVRLYRES